MRVYDAENIRNVGVIGHGGSGKTTLVSAMLFVAGAVNRLGSVDEGTTVTDYDEDEIERKISISSALAFCEWSKNKINIIDTPGYPDFAHDTRAAIRVTDGAFMVVNAVAGVEVQTEKLWEYCKQLGLPVIFVVNRLDRDNASFERALASLAEAFGRSVVPIQLPIGSEKNFRGVIDLVRNRAFSYERQDSSRMKEEPVPADLEGEVSTRREQLVEMVAETSDELMEKFFAEGTLGEAELAEGLRRAVFAGQIAPVLCTSAVLNIGTVQVLDAAVQLFPSPAEAGSFTALEPRTGEKVQRRISSDEPYSAYVFKTIADPFGGRISLFRVYSGVIRSDSSVYNVTRQKNEKFGTINALQGKTPNAVPEVRAGDIASVAKLKETMTGDTFADPNNPVVFSPVQFPEPAISFAIEPKSRGDEEKISQALQRIAEEDLGIRYEREPQTKELLISGVGQLHVEVTVARMKRRYGVDVNLKPPKIPYRETIRSVAEAQGKYKKQTGGHGQYGDCWIKMEPLARGADFEFVDQIFGGVIPKQYIPAVEKGIQEARQHGILAGYPVVDFKVTLFDGSYHEVDSSELAFKIAASMAFKKAMEQASPVLLEPIMNVEIYAPEEYAGDIMGELNARRGRVQGMDMKGSTQVIKAQVPLAEMLTFAPSLTSLTGGRGSYHMEFSHYDEVPAHLTQKIVEQARREKEER